MTVFLLHSPPLLLLLPSWCWCWSCLCLEEGSGCDSPQEEEEEERGGGGGGGRRGLHRSKHRHSSLPMASALHPFHLPHGAGEAAGGPPHCLLRGVIVGLEARHQPVPSLLLPLVAIGGVEGEEEEEEGEGHAGPGIELHTPLF